MRGLHATTIVLVAACVTAHADARELYVAVGGDDGASGTSWESAWRTPGRAFRALSPGDIVTIGDGRYPWGGQVIWRGTAEAPIEIRARNVGRAVLDGGARIEGWQRAPGTRHTWWASLPGERPVLLISEADTRRVLEQSIQPRDCESRLGCWAFDAGARRIYLRTSTGLPPNRHVIEASFEPWGLMIRGSRKSDVTTAHVILRGLVFKNYANAAVRPNRAENVLIEDCTVLQSGFGLQLWYSSFTTVRRCEVWATFDQRREGAAAIMFRGTARYSLAEDNYVHDVRQDGIRAYGGGSEGTRFLNNLIVGARDPLYFKGGEVLGLPDGNVVVGGRRFGNTGATDRLTGANTLVGIEAPLGHSPRDLIVKREQVARARFADPAYHDYRLQSDSPHRYRGLGAHPYRDEVRYAGPDGSDERDGGSVADAWRTLAHATAALRPGQTLYLLPGVYREPLAIRRGGSAERPTTVRAHGKGRVVIEPDGDAAGVLVEEAPFVTVEGIEVRGGGGAGFAVRRSPDCVLRRVVARDNRTGVAVEASPRGRLEHALLLGNRGSGLDLRSGSPGWSIRNTAFARNRGTQVAVSDDSAEETWLESNAYDREGAGGLGRWGDTVAADLAAWRAASGQDALAVAGAIELPGADAGDFDVEPGALLAGAGWLAATIGPGELDLEPPPAGFENLELVWVGARAAVVSWETPRREERTLAWYGAGDELSERITGPPGTFHSVTLADLEPDTRYRVRVAGGWRHPELPPPLAEEGVEPLRPFAQLARAVRRLEARGEKTGISRAIEFRTLAAPPPARRLHVAPGGDDEADGLAPERAWRTLSRAAAAARPGDEVLVAPGIYEEAVVPASGGATAERRIVYRSASPSRPVVLSGSGKTRAWGLRLRGRRHMTFRGFHFAEYESQDYGQVMLDGMNEDIVFRRCFFDGRGSYSGGIRTRYNSTNAAVVEDSAFLYNWGDIEWYYGSLTVRHVVFDVGIFGHVVMHRVESTLAIENSVATSAGRMKSVHSGHLISVESAEGVRSDYNRFYFQPYDQRHHLYRVGRYPYGKDTRHYEGAEGLERWRSDTGNGVHTRIVDDPRFEGRSARFEEADPKPGNAPRWLDDYRLASDSPLRGAASDGGDIGIRFPDARR